MLDTTGRGNWFAAEACDLLRRGAPGGTLRGRCLPGAGRARNAARSGGLLADGIVREPFNRRPARCLAPTLSLASGWARVFPGTTLPGAGRRALCLRVGVRARPHP